MFPKRSERNIFNVEKNNKFSYFYSCHGYTIFQYHREQKNAYGHGSKHMVGSIIFIVKDKGSQPANRIKVGGFFYVIIMLKRNSITAIVGKGGTGKSTVSAFLVKYLIERGEKPVLAIDADPSVCLGNLLGLEVEETLGDIREDIINGIDSFPQGMTKQQYLEFKVQSAVQESEYFDLLTMGRPEGKKCYCFVNNLLRNTLDTLTKNYLYTVIDCEAGMEHLSRRTTKDVDYLFINSDPTKKGIKTAQNILELINSLNTKVENKILIINRVPEEKSKEILDIIKRMIDFSQFLSVGIMPEDKAVSESDLLGNNMLKIPDSTCSYLSLTNIIEGI